MDQYPVNAAGTQCLTHAALAAGTTTTFSTTNATQYAIKGKTYSTNAATNAATPTTDANTGALFVSIPVNYGSVHVFCYDGSSATAATAIKVVQGSIELLNGADDGDDAVFVGQLPKFPVIPDTLCPFGYVITKVGTGGAAWRFGANNLADTAKYNHSFTSVATLPDRPQAS